MTERLEPARRGGLPAGLVAIAAGEIVAGVTARGRSPLSGLARGLVDAAPAALVDGGVALVGRADKPGLAVIATSVGAVAAGAGAALAARRPVLGAVVAVAPHALGGYLAHRHGDASARDTGAALAAGVLVAGTAVVRVRARPSTVLAAGAVALAADRRARRRAAARLGAGVHLPAATYRLSPTPASAATMPPGGDPLLMEPGAFPVIDVTVPEPRIDLDAWRLTLDGEVPVPVAFTLSELLEMPLSERDLLMVCVHNSVGGRRMGCARWTGISISDLLERAGVVGDEGWLVVEAVDGYTNVLPLADARDHGFLALGMAGRPLPREHGSPARLLVSGRPGQDGSTKWVRRLRVTTAAPLSYWGRRGWHDGTYPVHASARIDTPASHCWVPPGDVVVRGYAWAPPVGVDVVQVRVDDGPWTDADIGVDLGPDAWRPWAMTWKATPGRHELRVRCRSRDGQWQEETDSTPFPTGVRGIHTVTVHVGGSRGRARLRRLMAGPATRGSWAVRSIAAWRRRSTLVPAENRRPWSRPAR